MPKFTVYTDKHEAFRWRFTASDDRVIAKSSEGYRNREECLRSLALLQKDAPGASVKHRVRKGSQKSAAPGAPAPAGSLSLKPGVSVQTSSRPSSAPGQRPIK